MTHKWHKQDRNLVKGDILRVKATDGAYHYAVCTGGGFGCRVEAMGNAIFVNWPRRKNLKFVLEHREDVPERVGVFNDDDGARWERFWGIDYLVEG